MIEQLALDFVISVVVLVGYDVIKDVRARRRRRSIVQTFLRDCDGHDRGSSEGRFL